MAPGETKSKVLYVDDIEDLHPIVNFACESCGCTMTSAFSADQARHLLYSDGFDLVILDEVLPDGRGLEIISEFVVGKGAFPSKVMILSGHMTQERMERARALDVDEIVFKPFDVHELKGIIAALVETPESEPVSTYPADAFADLYEPVTRSIEKKESDPFADLFDAPESPVPPKNEGTQDSAMQSTERDSAGLTAPAAQGRPAATPAGTLEPMMKRASVLFESAAALEAGIPRFAPARPTTSAREGESLLESFFGDNDFFAGRIETRQASLKVRDDIPTDGTFSIWLNSDETIAFLNLVPPKNEGRPVTAGMVFSELEKMGIVEGVETGTIAKAIDGLGETGGRESIVIARGRVPRHGADGVVRLQFDGSGKPLLDVNSPERVDYHETGKIVTVTSGDLLAELIPPCPGEPGITVRGVSIPARDGRPVSLKCGENVECDEGGERFFASADGHVVVAGSIIKVMRLLHVRGDVDYSVGNIHFKGDVIIDGSVLDDFLVEATGTVTVHKNVYASVVRAGIDVVVNKGILNRNKGKVSACGTVSAKFCENSEIHAGQGIEIEKSAIHSCLRSNGLIRIVRGRIVGGLVMSLTGVSAPAIGSSSGGKTLVWVGRNFWKQMEEERLGAACASLSSLEARLRNDLITLKNNVGEVSGLSDQEKLLLGEILSRYKLVKQKSEEASAALEEQKPSGKDGFDSEECFVEVSARMHTGTTIRFGNFDFETPVDLNGRRLLKWHDGSIDISPAAGA